MTINTTPLDTSTFDKLKRLYIIALSAIAVSVVVSQLIIRKYLNDQQSDSSVINVAGRQRMLSQKLTKQILFISQEKDSEKIRALKGQLTETQKLWEDSHMGLKNGNLTLGLPGNNSKIIDSMFAAIEPFYQSIQKASRNIHIIPQDQLGETIAKNVSIVKNNEQKFLVLMDTIVNQYEKEANEKVYALRRLEFLLMIITLALLFFEFIFIFFPSAKFVKRIISSLIQSKNEALQSAKDADMLREKNENSVLKIRKFNDLMDKTLLFARVAPNGTVIDLGDKFSKRFKISSFSQGQKFYELISIHKKEQDEIQNILTTHDKFGWNGEIKATTKNKEDVWLDMYIVPFFESKGKTELVVVASDITKRKKAKLEIEKLTNDRYLEKVNQQKIITSKIIENQEREQKRIAKDMHDGIGQMLTGLKFNLESINAKNVDKTTEKVEYLKELAKNIIVGVRTATFNLAPPELGDYGIAPALAKFTTQINKYYDKKVQFYNKSQFNKRLDTLTEVNVYRVTQEAVNNALKYAESSHIIVSLSHSEKMLSVVIDDNGVGFDSKNSKRSKDSIGGLGLMFMKERVKYINGRIFINSSEGNGTRITVNIPIETT
ncbi:MAG: PAS domain-containing protein [Bacteroidetes bacterium]|nr:PAS domain-containing protein [Bacteroidota bacterium]